MKTNSNIYSCFVFFFFHTGAKSKGFYDSPNLETRSKFAGKRLMRWTWSPEKVLVKLFWRGDRKAERMRGGSLCVNVCVRPFLYLPSEFASVCIFLCLTKFRGAALEKEREKWEQVKDLNEEQKERGRNRFLFFWREMKTRHLEVCVARMSAASQHEERKLVRFIDWSCMKQQLSLGNISREWECERGTERESLGSRREIKSEAALIC